MRTYPPPPRRDGPRVISDQQAQAELMAENREYADWFLGLRHIPASSALAALHKRLPDRGPVLLAPAEFETLYELRCLLERERIEVDG